MANRQEAVKQNEQNKAQVVEKATQTEQDINKTKNEEASPVAEIQENTANNAPAVITEKQTEYVIVCLKHPQGIKFKLSDSKFVTINGNATGLAGQRSPVLPTSGFGMTKILKEEWEAIKKTYSSMEIFKAGLIFANADSVSASSQSKEYDEIKSGYEPIDVTKEINIDELNQVKNFEK